MLDMKENGLRNSINYWNEKSAETGITMIGGYTKADYDNIRFVEKDGVKIALLSYLTMINYNHRNDISESSELLIPYANEADMTRQVGIAREQGADFIIVAIHWGDENAFRFREYSYPFSSDSLSMGW